MSRRSIIGSLAVGLFVLMTLAGLILAAVLAVRGDGFAVGERVAVIEVEGLIGEDEALLQQIRHFRRDESVKAFVLAINSPGGVVGPAQSIYRELKRIGDDDGTPVVASIGAVGASGGYYVALAADSIYALPGSMTGSIGVIMQFPDAGELMDRVGLRMEVVKSGRYKDLGLPFRAMSDGERAVLASVVEDVHDQFVTVVVQERGLPRQAVEGIADGRIFTGRQAVDVGLVDRIGNVYDAIAAAGRMAGIGPNPPVVRPEEGTSLLDLLLGTGVSGTLRERIRALDRAVGPQLEFVVPF